MPVKAFMSWSSGKDSAFALHVARKSGEVEICGLLTTISEAYDRVAMHGVRDSLLDLQAAALGLPVRKISIPADCSNRDYETRMGTACAGLRAQGIHDIVFGDLFLEDIRQYREKQLSPAGMRAHFPLWKRDTCQLAEEMIASGLTAYITCIDPRRLPHSFAGRRFDTAFLRDLPAGVDPCGENGEFHTFVAGGPMFRQPVAVTMGETVERDGFVFTDIVPASNSPSLVSA